MGLCSLLTCMCVRSLRSPGVIPWVTSFVLTRKGFVGSIAHVPDIRPAERDARKCRRSSAGGLVSLKRQRKTNACNVIATSCQILFFDAILQFLRRCPCAPIPAIMCRSQWFQDRSPEHGRKPIDLEEPSPEAATPTNRASLSVITDFDMCKVCTEALWTRTLSQVWTCVKYVPKQSTA